MERGQLPLGVSQRRDDVRAPSLAQTSAALRARDLASPTCRSTFSTSLDCRSVMDTEDTPRSGWLVFAAKHWVLRIT